MIPNIGLMLFLWFACLLDKEIDRTIKHPLWLRRLFVLTFPISIPLILVLAGLSMFLALLLAVVNSFTAMMAEQWRKP